MNRDAIEGHLALGSALIAEARRNAKQSGRHMLEVLEESTAHPPHAFLASLGETLHYPTLSMAALNQLEPAFVVCARSCAMTRTRSTVPQVTAVQDWLS